MVDPLPLTAMVRVCIIWEKLAVTVLSALMVTVVLTELGSATSPVQLTNWYPGDGSAEIGTTVPQSYVPPPVAEPPSDGLTFTVSV